MLNSSGVSRALLFADVLEREVVADQRPLHRAGRDQRRGEHHEDAATPDAQEQLVVRPQPGDQRADPDHARTGPDEDRDVPDDGLHPVSAFLSSPDCVLTFGGV